jgi:long-chain fatty acid transport protein
LAVGFGEYTLYGASFIWEDKFEGRYVPSGKEGTIQTVTLSPVVAFKITDGLSVGLGGRVEYLKTVFDNLNYVAPAFPQPNIKMTAKDWAPGWDIALLYKITENFSTGIHYRSEINHKTDGDDVKFTPQLRMLEIRDTKASFDFSFPQNVTFGFAWSQGPVTLTLDGTWWNWSHSNQDLVVKFNDKVAFKSTQISPWDWNDSWSVGIGGEYRLNALNRVISLRAGYMWDQCPIPDSTVSPASFQNDNHVFSIGTGFPIGPLYTDLFAAYVLTPDRDWNNSIGDARHPGKFFGNKRITGEFDDYNTFLFGIDLSYKF